MPKYRKIPIVITAEQFSKKYPECRIKGVLHASDCASNSEPGMINGDCDCSPLVETIHKGQTVIIEDGDYIIPEPDGIHYYPCKSDIFNKSYELVIV